MVKKVTGYQIANGAFYETKEEAAYEETKLLLHTTATSAIQVTAQNYQPFLDFIEANAELVAEHCNNYIALQSSVTNDPDKEELENMREGSTVNDKRPSPSTDEDKAS